MTCGKPDRDLERAALDERRCQKIAATLGASPRDALSALVGYGLKDREIARNHRLTQDLVTVLRELWSIPPNH